ncbi:hypothetical protein H2O73_07150 [Vibrio sp. 404]|uniref:DUF6701 domain-containing protein n=1 Tax=Vibrio marinisediminis TaxID=2758441 RepID=A0A7W2ITI6_9VIBR|nr:DUF6701 domain-containing protein [Vibrio marinisediminis]MBA5762112.1 hypothetical protein [Vibrio marinisediminis]
MKRFLTVLFFTLVSLTVLADEDLVEYCKVDYKKDFTLYADYGKQHSDFYSQYPGNISKNKWDFDEEVFFFASDKKKDRNKTIKVWSSDDDHENSLFYDPSVDEDKGATVRFDYQYTRHSANSYYGNLTYYVYQDGHWSKGITKSITTQFTSHKAYAVFEHEDDDDELHNLRCGDLDTPPELPVFKLDICPYVPNTVQTNYLLANDKPFGALQVSASNYVHLGNYETQFFLSSSTGVRDCVLPDGTVTDCKISDQKPDIDGFPVTLGSFPNTGNKSDIDCKLDNTVDCYLTPGIYKDVKVAEGATLVLQGGQYFFKELKFEAEDARLEVKAPTEVNYKEILFEKSGIEINTSPGSKSENLLFIGHGEDANFYLESDVSNVVINAYVFIDKEADDKDNGFGFTGWNNTLNGGVTSHSIAISGGNNRIKATNNLNCFDPPSSDISTINVVPSNIYLQCADSKLIYVEVFDKDGQPISDIGDNMVSLYSTTPNALTFSLVRFDDDKSRFEFSIDSKAGNDYGEIEVAAHVVGDNSISDNSHVVFAPVVFDINNGQEKELIAGKVEQVDIEVLACDSNGDTITGNYNKAFSQELLQNSNFVPGQWSDSAEKLSFDADIKQGLAIATIQFDEAGQYIGRLVDTIKCEDFYQTGVDPVDCPRGESKEISGELKFKARPWTFAVCHSASSALPSGNISDAGSAGFTAAGDNFDIAVLPIRWQSGGGISGSIATQDGYCDITKVTVNFAKGEAGTLEIPLVHNLTLPTVASGGKEGSLSGSTTKSYLDDINGYYLFNDLSWNEVGQIQLQASSGDYLGMGIQPGYKAVGRFYPKFFKVSPDSTSWDYASGQGFNYMNQPFDGLEFSVEAFTANESDIVNYRYFESELQAKFILEEQDYLQDDSTPRLVTPIINATSWDSRLTSTLGVFNVSAGDDCLSTDSLCWLKATTKAGYEDGPFNLFESDEEGITKVTNIVIADGGSVDPIAFRTAEDRLTTQPDLRFGRATLSSVGGVASNDGVKVPLRLEYWSGTRFVINVNDSASDVKGSNLVASNNVIWSDVEAPEVPAEVSLSDGGIVSEGISHLIVAKQDKLERQQTQVWLELVDGNNKLPWLQYLWDSGSGVEGNPATVVTFGIYRGNDKIIFRGESELIGQ